MIQAELVLLIETRPRPIVEPMDKLTMRASMSGTPPVTAEVSASVSDVLFTWLSSRLPGTITAYCATGSEIDVGSLIDRLPGWRWLLPRVENDGSLTWRDAGLPRERHRWGMDQPIGSGVAARVSELDYMLVPGLAFDRQGNRLGRGGGFYDRELAAVRSDCVSIGVTIEERVQPEVPSEPHDVRVDYLATELGVTATNANY